MQEGDLNELTYVHGDLEVRLVRRSPGAPIMTAAPIAAAAPVVLAPPAAAAAPAAAAPPADPGEVFRSPMVGTFYRRANPEADNYVNPGDSVQAETVLCLIEAMKVFNEIKAEFRGTILEALVQDGETVEYNQPLFRIRK